MKPTPHTAAVLGLCAALFACATACTAEDTAKPDKVGAAETLPTDTDKKESRKQAEDFRSWVKEHGTTQEKAAVVRVERIIGEWDEHTGNAYVSTDINGGKTEVKDPQAAADAIVEAFGGWKDSDQGFVSVYDVFGNAMVTNKKF
ncbi:MULTISPECIES: hypothetical protein [unclassified Streptomyces]|uniref:hypothetical protein n=1 Tax=unclassified Streptomyces TaxID=2593676 RepID=UPI0033D3512C